MEGQHKPYQDLPIKPYGSRSINHIGGSVTGNETPTANPVAEELPVVGVEKETQPLEAPAIEIQTDIDGNVTDVTGVNKQFEAEYGAEYSNVADEAKEIEPPVTKKKSIK